VGRFYALGAPRTALATASFFFVTILARRLHLNRLPCFLIHSDLRGLAADERPARCPEPGLVEPTGNYGDSALYPNCRGRGQAVGSLAFGVRSRALPAQIPLRRKPNFPSPFNPITPVQISRQKYSALRFPQITRTLSRIPPHEEGRFAIVTNVEAGCGGRDGSQASHADERADPPSRGW
jgi:hypothetical protein